MLAKLLCSESQNDSGHLGPLRVTSKAINFLIEGQTPKEGTLWSPWCQFSRSSLVSARVSGLPLSTTELCQQHYCKNERDISFVSFFSICSHETLNELFFHEMLDEFSVHKMCEAVLINTRRLPFTPGFINQGGINTSMCAIALAIPLSPHTLGTGMRP